MTQKLRVNTIQHPTAVHVSLVKQTASVMWAQFRIDGALGLIQSLNVSSTTDLGVGRPEFNFTNSLATVLKANVCAGVNLSAAGTELPRQTGARSNSTGSCLVRCGGDTDAAVEDYDRGSVNLMGDLA